jgi:hypothetical protein
MLHREIIAIHRIKLVEIIAVCSEILREHRNTLCGQNLEFLSVNILW